MSIKRPASVITMGSSPDSDPEFDKEQLPAVRGQKKRRLQQKQQDQQPNPTTAWDAITAEYSAEISTHFPTQASLPESLTIVKYLATLPAVHASLDYNQQRIRGNPFTLEIGIKGTARSSEEKYAVFHARNRLSRIQGNLKAVLAQASGSPNLDACNRCAVNRGMWKTCMKAATMPGLNKGDTLGGSCPSCYYNGAGHLCSNRPSGPQSMPAVAQYSLSHLTDGESSYQPSSTSQVAADSPSESPSHYPGHEQTVSNPDNDQNQSGNDPNQLSSDVDEDSRANDLEKVKMQLLIAENAMLKSQIETLQARVEELEDMIEAEESQFGI